MSRHSYGAQYFAKELIRIIDQRLHQIAVSLRVSAKRAAGIFKRFVEKRRRAVVERMSESGGRVDPFYAPLLKLQRAKEWRDDGGRVNGRADVVNESACDQFG
jgi:hypothetical protein